MADLSIPKADISIVSDPNVGLQSIGSNPRRGGANIGDVISQGVAGFERGQRIKSREEALLERKQKQDDDAEYAKASGNIQAQSTELWEAYQREADEGSIGDEKFLTGFQERFSSYSKSITDEATNDRVRDRLQTRLDQVGQFYQIQARRKQAAITVKQRTEALDDSVNGFANASRLDPKQWQGNEALILQNIEALKDNFTPEQTEEITRLALEKNDVNYIEGVINGSGPLGPKEEGKEQLVMGPDTAIKLLKSERFRRLPPNTHKQLMQLAEHEKEVLEDKEKSAQKADRILAQFNYDKSLKDLEANWKNGEAEPLPDDETLKDLEGDHWKAKKAALQEIKDQNLFAFRTNQKFADFSNKEINSFLEDTGSKKTSGQTGSIRDILSKKLAKEHKEQRLKAPFEYAIQYDENLKQMFGDTTPEGRQDFLRLMVKKQTEEYGIPIHNVQLFSAQRKAQIKGDLSGLDFEPGERGKKIAGIIEGLRAELGNDFQDFGFSQLIKEKVLPPEARRYLALDDIQAKDAYVRVLNNGFKTFSDLLENRKVGGKSEFTVLKEEVSKKMKSVNATTIGQIDVRSDMNSLVKEIATVYASSFDMPFKKAVDLAHKQVIGDQYVISERLRLPKNLFGDEVGKEAFDRFEEKFFDKLLEEHQLPASSHSRIPDGLSLGDFIHSEENNNKFFDEIFRVPRISGVDVIGTQLERIKEKDRDKPIAEIMTELLSRKRFFFMASDDEKGAQLFIEYDDVPMPVAVKDDKGTEIIIPFEDIRSMGLRSLREDGDGDVEGLPFLASAQQKLKARQKLEAQEKEAKKKLDVELKDKT